MALKTRLGQRWLAGWIVSSMLKSHNHSHPAAAQRGGKQREGQARASDQSWSSAKFNITPLTCANTLQMKLFWLVGAGSRENSNSRQQTTLFSIETVPGVTGDSISNTCMLASAFGKQRQRLPELCYGKQQGSESRTKQDELSWEFPQICWFFPRIMGHAPSVGI